ncbi:Homoserine/homoserine lactone efflux protein [Aeromonas hydrophila]|uniref:Transporter, LysE family n=2 Tax=Aeromonas hydrophila TaxID=644 RepID=A0KIA8_AERHH|nr:MULTISPECIES: LysE family translocator [Aeromonas]GKQ64228.1 threonine transporter RhtB [Aeromonas caviae]ABK36636.1 transporter, LysE family [Aeromonas hydrophila subsp. hydrophila ATCC 7966]AJQ54027.1 threonine transporter RhtB [Aeromonas hydrophila]APJ14701.1 threonine transporter RhtB [Aeromonas hydrophila]AUZ75823.1 LysE family translocator [Aeromonas sp. ASNIH4]
MSDWIDPAILALFIPTFFFVSVTPGMCMTLAMTLGMSLGVRRTLHMMWGELIGVGLVSVLSVIGVAAVMLNYPALFAAFKYVGGAYLIWLGIQMWQAKGKLAIPADLSAAQETRPLALAMQGFVTAIANPKGWAFMVSLLPPFINAAKPMAPQISALVALILVIEFSCLLLYASGGRTLRHFLAKSGNVTLMNRIAGSLMFGVGVWLALG